jgi:hypothetical protein
VSRSTPAATRVRFVESAFVVFTAPRTSALALALYELLLLSKLIFRKRSSSIPRTIPKPYATTFHGENTRPSNSAPAVVGRKSSRLGI